MSFGKDSPLAITSLTTGYLTDSGYIWTPFIIKQLRIENRTAGILLKLQSEPSTSQFFNVLSCCMSLSWSIRRTSLCIVDDRIRKFDTTSQLLMLMLGKTEMRRRLSFTLDLFPETESKSESVTQDSVNWRCIPIKNCVKGVNVQTQGKAGLDACHHTCLLSKVLPQSYLLNKWLPFHYSCWLTLLTISNYSQIPSHHTKPCSLQLRTTYLFVKRFIQILCTTTCQHWWSQDMLIQGIQIYDNMIYHNLELFSIHIY